MVAGNLSQLDSRWYTLQRHVQGHKIREVFQIFRGHGIEPIVFKGWAAARYYPPDIPRSMGDIDLAVEADNYPKALELIKSDEVSRLFVDLHREFRQLDTVPWSDIVSNSELVELDGVRVRVPRAEDHLRLLCVHWLTDGGGNRERLWDIYYLVTNRSQNFDWSMCLDTVAPRRRRWIICTIGLAHRYLGLDITNLPFRDECMRIPEWVARCVENEWKRGGQIEPLLTSNDWRTLVDQLRRRLPPNPIRSVIEAEGNIDRKIIFDYQIRVLGRRAIPFFKDLGQYITGRVRPDWRKTGEN